MEHRSHDHDLTRAAWQKSSHSGGDGANCLEIATGFHGIVPVRDSKNTAGPALLFRAPAWAEFVVGIRNSAA
ncbi:DUF397 domain-containing protein [Streptomyces sp. TS71-3]|uniref:DUF397 domain-containing protein n=1 Tax=Streptomyces sp. TS71-3 TaxID=2733862 RepID=UPI001B1BCE04|nr:DUF397 domain-containing protein [Streptomyces sp. TS71-3]GHJ34533.1 hypothetical protein Sm713_01420 [Streptomyces sp. TS71-3]